MGKILTTYFIGDKMEWIKDINSEELIPLEEFEEKYGGFLDDE